MDRRAFLGTLAGSLLAAPLAAQAQPTERRIGYLMPVEIRSAWQMLLDALRELGYVEGRNIRLDVRSAENDPTRLPQLAAALVEAKVEVIVAMSPPAIRAASHATRAIPVVMAYWGGGGLVESGIVKSFAHPGGNVTGISMLAEELDAKRLALLLEALPNARRIAVLNRGTDWSSEAKVRHVADTAKVQLYITPQPTAAGYERAFEAMVKAHVDGLLVPSSPRFFTEQQEIIQVAARRGVPAIYEFGDLARAGGLMGYGPTLAELVRRAAFYIDKILKGAKPGDLPIEQPEKFELVINLKTAQALGLTIPPPLLQRADQVIE